VPSTHHRGDPELRPEIVAFLASFLGKERAGAGAGAGAQAPEPEGSSAAAHAREGARAWGRGPARRLAGGAGRPPPLARCHRARRGARGRGKETPADARGSRVGRVCGVGPLRRRDGGALLAGAGPILRRPKRERRRALRGPRPGEEGRGRREQQRRRRQRGGLAGGGASAGRDAERAPRWAGGVPAGALVAPLGGRRRAAEPIAPEQPPGGRPSPS
jgi:hypothetical protein